VVENKGSGDGGLLRRRIPTWSPTKVGMLAAQPSNRVPTPYPETDSIQVPGFQEPPCRPPSVMGGLQFGLQRAYDEGSTNQGVPPLGASTEKTGSNPILDL
jgi:hypothetical protein